MPRMLRMPSKDALPAGPKRELVTELFVHYREAARPPLPRIESLTKTMPDSHPVSRETIRRLLTGTTTSQWTVVDAVLRALCHLQGRDPDGRRWAEADDHWDDDPSHLPRIPAPTVEQRHRRPREERNADSSSRRSGAASLWLGHCGTHFRLGQPSTCRAHYSASPCR